MKNPPFIPARNACMALAVFIAGIALVDPVFAQALEPVVRTSNIMRDTIVAICLAILTIAWGVAGFKISFAGASFRDMSGPIIGGAIAGSAAALAAVFIT
jgi:hypothetical protein